VVARAWADEGFKRRLLADPKAVLQEHGLAAPPGVEVRVVENTATVLYLALPARPAGELTEADLAKVAAGGAPPGPTDDPFANPLRSPFEPPR
jgi:hypothetical protein